MLQRLTRRITTLILLVVLTSLVNPVQALGASYYVDCAGSDSNDGTAENIPWKSLSKANTAPLQPGASLRFRRGCTWTGRLSAKWNGTTTAPITIGAYGVGNLPIIQADSSLSSSRIEITGNYQVLEDLDVRTINAKTDPNCKNQTIGYFVGFNFLGTSHHNTVQNSKTSGHTIGVHITDNSNHNKILHNEIFNNAIMNQLTPDASPDLGAWGIDLRGDDNEIAYNYFHDNNGWCAYDFSIKPGNAVELYNADRNLIHHNKVINDRVFSEVGHDASHTSDDNIWAYNVFISNTGTSRFLVLHNSNNAFGPVHRSKVFNNSVYLTGTNSTGINSDDAGNIVKNNIIFATSYLTNGSGFTQTNNIFWSPDGTPQVKALGVGDKKVDPIFINPEAGDLHLQSLSPAINSGAPIILPITPLKDFDGKVVPQGIAPDIGAFEFGASVTPTNIINTPLTLVVLLHGIGKGGDNVNPSSVNLSVPLHAQRPVALEFYDVTNQLIATKAGAIIFKTANGNFEGSLDATNLKEGSYQVKIKVPYFLKKTLPGIVSITTTQIRLPQVSLIAGDSNNDNALSVLDYNILLDCFSDLSQAKDCLDANKKTAADITDDGRVDQFDYNLFLRELSVQAGQ